MIKASPIPVQTSQEPLLTRIVKLLRKHQSHLTLPGALLNLHYTTVAEHGPGTDFCKGRITFCLPLPPTKISSSTKKILYHYQGICPDFSRATAQMLFSSSDSSALALRTCSKASLYLKLSKDT